MGELKPGLFEAIKEIRGWREITVQAYKAGGYTDPETVRRSTQNQLNLLDLIISNLRQKAGETPKQVFQDMKSWERVL